MDAGAPHRRYNPLLGEWVLVSPHRLARPWQGQVATPARVDAPSYDPNCYLCPGNARAGHARNPPYTTTFVFENDFPALLPPDRLSEAAAQAVTFDDPRRLFVAQPEPGLCRVVCFSPRHDASIPVLSLEDVRRVVDVWTEQFVGLAATPWVGHVQIFENRGAAMGASNPHPHGQIWANATVPDVPAREGQAQREYRSTHKSCLLCDYLASEIARGERTVLSNAHFSALVPFWAVWPFETIVVPSRHVTALDELSEDERAALADILRRVTSSYDALFDAACPYSMGFHQRPVDGPAYPEWHLHAHVFPPVLRSAVVHKFMVGYELLATPQRDITAEIAADMLRHAARKTS